MSEAPDLWRKCSSCKKPIGFNALYWVCNVSTCNRKRTGLVFCSVSCWDAHNPLMNHRDSWAEERRSPTQAQWQQIQSQEDSSENNAVPTSPKTKERIMSEENNQSGGGDGGEVLVVASKLKNYIRAKSGMNTSAAVMEALSAKIRQMCDNAIETARRDGRKTVMDRDFG